MVQSDSDHAIPLLSDTARLMREVFRRRAQHVGMTQLQWRVLLTVRRWSGLSQAALAARLEVHAVTVTQAGERLVRSGWVNRVPDARDRRAVRLYLTEQATPALVDLDRIGMEMQQAALAGLDAQQHALLVHMLGLIKRNLNAAVPDGATAFVPEGPT